MERESFAPAEWLAAQFAQAVALAFESLGGARLEVTAAALPDPAPVETASVFRQSWNGLSGAIYLAAPPGAVTAIGRSVSTAAGIENPQQEEEQSSYREICEQAFAALGQAISARLGREVTPATLELSAHPPGQLHWSRIQVALAEPTELILGLPAGLLEEIAAQPATPDAARSPAATGAPQTFDLLLDVELPVSVSFGRAQVPLKDVLKLTTGSIVELNRAVVEPVDVVVNNCVIARGEVVVVEGNFGVRIQQVISRSERLRSLPTL